MERIVSNRTDKCPALGIANNNAIVSFFEMLV